MGLQLASISLEHTENGNFFVYLCPKEIKDSTLLALQIAK